ncbi:methyl-accepting chemotaxis protein [Gracilibacillus halophilus YIM-C55.5]|uniref:Methyl-accepting chemotaxis protein n=1 Tax=Gracilibacillus halophilus YIM-C55.5 TaxID=1308866 RepID=N4WIY8_9BACI|nr:methyl-accepting chemotaxis protein [Gracilibacillus halophilus]ENH96087.1 methyl-accepting chemotaxis protein [Gracilibacillus halophilus YIM-C55.5]
MTRHERNLVTTKALLESQDGQYNRQQYRDYFESLLPSNEETYGLGVWYEPYAHNEDDEYFGPYVYKGEDSLQYTEDYEEPSYDYHSQGYYTQGIEADTPIWTTPYYDETLDQTFITTAVSFANQEGTTQGVLTSDYVLNSVQSLVADIKVEDTGYAALIGKDGTFLSHPDQEKILSASLSDEISNENVISQINENSNGDVTLSLDGTEYEVHYETLPKVGWKLMMFAPTDELYASLPALLNKLIITSVALVILIVLLVFFIGRTVSKDAKKLNTYLEGLAQGDLTDRIDVQSSDELGQMGQYYNHSVNSLHQMLQSITKNSEHVASTSEQLSASSQEINSSVEEVATSIQEVANNATSQNEIANQLSGSSEKMHENMNDMADSMKMMNQEASQSTDRASQGSKNVKDVVEKMHELNKQIKSSSDKIYSLDKKSDQIGEMSRMITEITEQTNLLALNAAIEAARAGEAGKGFSVVAEEVRKLAEQTGQTSSQINDMVEDVQKEVSESVTMMEQSQTIADEGIQSVERSGESFDTITSSIYDLSEKITSITSDMEKSLADMKEMKELSDKVQNYSHDTSDHANNVSATTEEQLSMMNEVANASESLAEMAQQLQEEMSQFNI